MAKPKLKLITGGKTDPDELAIAATSLEAALASVEEVKAIEWTRSSLIGLHRIGVNLQVSSMESMLNIVKIVRDTHYQMFRRTWNEDPSALWDAAITGTNRKFLKVSVRVEAARQPELMKWMTQIARELGAGSST